MNYIEPFEDGVIKALADILSNCSSGSEIGEVLADVQLEDVIGARGSKSMRLYYAFKQSQQQHKGPSRVIRFIGSLLSLSRFVGRSEQFEQHRSKLNGVMSLVGLEYNTQGKFVKIERAKTLEEAEKYARKVRRQFAERVFHPQMLTSCGDELAKEDYYHAAFEAVKGLAQRVRDKSGVELEGAALIDQVFSVKKPILAFNTLETESEQSEHKGLAMLLKGCISTVRHPRAHTPRVRGDMDDATDLALVSLLHQKLDSCHKTNLRCELNN